jgi:hypothetical protein
MDSSDGQITIRIGAELERSIEVSFGALENRANAAGKNVAKALGGGSGGAIKQVADTSAREFENSLNRQVKASEKAANERKRIDEKAANERRRLDAAIERERDRFFRQETRNAEREAERQEKIAERQAARAQAAMDRFARRTSQRSVRFLFPNPIGAFGMASRIGGDILRGAGVDFSMAGIAQRAVQSQALATQLSNQGFMPHEKGANSQRVAAAQLESEARKTAQAQGFTTEQTLRSQTKFVDLTGNLDDARKALPSIMKLSGATGTDPEKMAEAWANVSRHMGDIPDKAAKVEGLMRLIAGQGRVGSIEIKDEAKDLGKIAAMADKFGGDRATSIGKLATLAQLAKAEGGAASSAQAATSVVSFVNTMQTPARVKSMLNAGMKEEDLFNMTGTGKNRVRSSLKDPFEIIKKGLEVTGGDLIKFGKLFNSVMSQRATNALVAAYNSGGGRNTKAVDAKLNEFGAEAALSDKDVDAAQNERLKTAAAQATIFQEKLDEVGKGVEAELLPALHELAPLALQAAEGLGTIVTWAAKNPMEALGVAIGGAIARATIESAFRAGIEKMVTGAMTQGGIQMLGPVGITIAAATIAMHLIDKDIEDAENKQRADAISNAEAGSKEGAAENAARKGTYSTENKADDEAIEKNLKERLDRIAKLKNNEYGVYDEKPGEVMLGLERAFNPRKAEARVDSAHENELKAELEKVHHRLEMLRTGVLKVQVMNPTPAAGGGPPTVPPGGRSRGF